MSIAATSAVIDSPKAVVVHPVSSDSAIARPVSLGLGWGKPASVVAPSWSGIVQEVLAKPGDQITSGTPLVRIDGVVRVAAQTKWPFSRPLAPGDTGEDVIELAAFLRSQGIDAPDSASFGDALLGSLRAWVVTVSSLDPKAVTAFDPGWVVYLAQPEAVLTADLVVGAPAPTSGTEIFTLAPTLLDAVLLDSGTAAPQGGSEASTGVNEALVPTDTASQSESLMVADQNVHLDDSRQRVSTDGLSGLAGLVTPGEAIASAILSQPSSPDYWELPAPSLIAGEQSGTCVFTSQSGELKVLRVDVIASVGSTVVVDGPLSANTDVLIFPTTTKMTCPS